MKSKAYITYYRNQLLTALYEDNQLVELFADDLEKKDLLDRIYIGKVKNIVTNIDAAFVDIGGGIEGYYSLKENTNHLFVITQKRHKTCYPVMRFSFRSTGKILKQKHRL